MAVRFLLIIHQYLLLSLDSRRREMIREIRNVGIPMIPAGSHQFLQKAQNCSSAKS